MTERTGEAPTNRAVRLTVEYEGRRFRVVGRQRVEMATPASDPIRGYEGQSGFWYELRGAKGEVLYRRVIANPIQYDVEAHDPETGSRRYPVDRPRGVFVVLVPEHPEGDSLVLMSSPFEPEKRAARAQEVARFPFAERRRAR